MGIDLDWPSWQDNSALDHCSVAVLVVTPDLDVAERWLAHGIADLARRHDVVVVCGSGTPDTGQLTSYALTTQLRDLLPRRAVIAVLVSDHRDAVRHEFATIEHLVDESAVAVAVTMATDPIPVATSLAGHLHTRTLLRLDRAGYRTISSDPAPT